MKLKIPAYPFYQDLRFLRVLIFFCILFLSKTEGYASLPNHLQRIDLVHKQNYTRIKLKLSEEPEYTLIQLPGKKLRVNLKNTDGSLFKKLRHYSDRNIGGILLTQRGSDLSVTFQIAKDRVSWRDIQISGMPTITIDVGAPFLKNRSGFVQPGRERIVSGAEKLLRDFDPPLKPEIPFIPTDKESLKGILNNDELKQFVAAEASLYKGKITPAEEIFANFAARTGTAIRPLALYRLGEAQYRLQKYQQALASFREAEGLWRDFMSINPSSMFYYGDSIARSGDLPVARQLLSRLIVANADKKYAPLLLVRMADAMARQGNEQGAVAIYKTVGEYFKDNKAHQIARMKLADRSFFLVNPDTYKPLAATYRDIAEKSGDFDLREEASFKAVLLESINAPVDTSLDSVKAYEKKFPKSVFIKVLHDIRDDLVEVAYLKGGWDKDPASLIKLVTDNQDYLAQAVRVKGFFQSVSAAYDKAGRPLDMIVLYTTLLEKPWIGDRNAPYLYLAISEQAEILGDSLMAKKMLRSFSMRFPADPNIRLAKERLGALSYADGETKEVATDLQWLLNKDEKAKLSDSYYYLGRSLWKEKKYPQAAMAMKLYIESVKPDAKKVPPFLWDAYYVAGMLAQNSGNRNEALALLDSGRKIASKETRDQFSYKIAEINLQNGQPQKAKAIWEDLAKTSIDPDWRRLASQSLEDLKLSGTSADKTKVK